MTCFLFTEPDRTGSAKKRRCTRKQSEVETATKRRKATARRNTSTGNIPAQINSNISGTYYMWIFCQFPHKTRSHTTYFALYCFVLLLLAGSESEDNSDPINSHKLQRPSKSHQYNFLVQLGTSFEFFFKIFLLLFHILIPLNQFSTQIRQ